MMINSLKIYLPPYYKQIASTKYLDTPIMSSYFTREMPVCSKDLHLEENQLYFS